MAGKGSPARRTPRGSSPSGSRLPAPAPPARRPLIPDLNVVPPPMTSMDDVEAAVAELPAKMEELRQSYDRLVACSPMPLPIFWADMEAYVTSAQTFLAEQVRAHKEVLAGGAPASRSQTVLPVGTAGLGVDIAAPGQGSGEVVAVVEAPVGEMKVDTEAPAEMVVAKTAEEGDAMDEYSVQQAIDAKMEEAKKATPNKEDGKVLTTGGGGVGSSAEQASRGRVEPVPRRRLAAACEGMVPADLADLVRKSGRDIRCELLPALRRAPDAPALVLGAVGAIVPDAQRVDDRAWENLAALLRCVRLLINTTPLDVSKLEEQAVALAKEWSRAIAQEEEGCAATWALLHFLSAYGVAARMEDEEIMLLHTLRGRKDAVDLIKTLGLAGKATELIDRLIENGQQVDAVKVARAFSLTDKYPPVSLVKPYVERIKEAALDILSKAAGPLDSLDDAMEEGVSALRSAKDAIEVHDAESSYRYKIMQIVHEIMTEHEKKRGSPTGASPSSSSGAQKKRKNKNRKKNQRMAQGNQRRAAAVPVYLPLHPQYASLYSPYQQFDSSPPSNPK